MDSIKRDLLSSSVRAVVTHVKRLDESSGKSVIAVDPTEDAGKEVELSAFAQQLGAAAERAAARDSQLSRKELAAFAARILDSIGGAGYLLAKDFYDSQLPDTDDPELIERAKKANAFAMGTGDNPFKGLSRDQLSLIIYDESGAFTISERRAALSERTEQHNAWARHIIDKMNSEYRKTGRIDNGLQETLDYYKSLPPVEVAQYGNYEAGIMMQMGLQEVERPEFNISLMDLMANEWKLATESDPSSKDPEAALPATDTDEEGARG
ncbi:MULTISPECIES: hypothetical protein [Pseudomonas]|uniref:Uncharacterized protein n=1 Tax=Pseudomonas taiwanensis TaxID=470150 RepID=A0ABR6VBW1_9PSED|nr:MULTISPECIES: hypothetical protein [Pseudomonas]AGZ33656.1 hypothetical protein PVLB_04245 [Pseudomonas sp. VLB120]MBC3477610.1 hypothetical protein [Pseudomonas taiwanensis]MBC3492914.1 hypothetical protein [Pseudomonas taiwanensis]QQZ37153.1 hypothetical protein IF103_04230 [Pseudomonas sp. SK2]